MSKSKQYTRKDCAAEEVSYLVHSFLLGLHLFLKSQPKLVLSRYVRQIHYFATVSLSGHGVTSSSNEISSHFRKLSRDILGLFPTQTTKKFFFLCPSVLIICKAEGRLQRRISITSVVVKIRGNSL